MIAWVLAFGALVFVLGCLLMALSLCRVSGDSDRALERQREHKAVQGNGRKYSD